MTVTRREFLAGGALAMAGAAMIEPQTARGEDAAKPVLTLAHLTDIHVKPELHGIEGMAAALAHAQNHPTKPELILNGGDAIFDALAATHDRTAELWGHWKKIVAANCSLPMINCLGNHDIYGWSKKKSGATGAEADYGKKWALEVHGMEKPYYSVDRAGWHFIVLDSIQPNGNEEGVVYSPYLDEEQFAWLSADIAATNPKTPILILSHVPLVSAATFYWPKDGRTTDGSWPLLAFLTHGDSRRLKDLFIKHPNVKLCLSGHIHLVEDVRYAGVRYICSGAVSGNWWNGNFQECVPGYSIIKLYADGTADWEYVEWGWKKQD